MRDCIDFRDALALGDRLQEIVDQHAREGGLVAFQDSPGDGPTLTVDRSFDIEGFVRMCRAVVHEADDRPHGSVKGLVNLGLLA